MVGSSQLHDVMKLIGSQESTMEHWKRNNPSLQVGDSEDNPIIVSDDEEVEAPPSSEESYHAPPLAECIGPVFTGQCAIHSALWEYQKVREE